MSFTYTDFPQDTDSLLEMITALQITSARDEARYQNLVARNFQLQGIVRRLERENAKLREENDAYRQRIEKVSILLGADASA